MYPTVSRVGMEGQLGRIPSIPGYLVYQTVSRVGMEGQLGRIPSIPGYLVYPMVTLSGVAMEGPHIKFGHILGGSTCRKRCT